MIDSTGFGNICLRSTIGFKPGKRTVVRIAMHSVDKSPGTARETRSVIMGLSLAPYRKRESARDKYLLVDTLFRYVPPLLQASTSLIFLVLLWLSDISCPGIVIKLELNWISLPANRVIHHVYMPQYQN